MYVDKKVSDDLKYTDVSKVDLKYVPFPTNCLEINFEDPEIPSTLLFKCTSFVFHELNYKRLIKKYGPGTKVYPSAYYIVNTVKTISGESGLNTLEVHNSNWKTLCDDPMSYFKAMDASNGPELKYFSNLIQLCIKVLIYSSIQWHTREIPKAESRKLRKRQSKQSQKRPAVRVVYLPQVVKNTPSEGDGTTKKRFLGRRGFLRHYKDDRYVNKKGTFQYIAPVRGPNGEIPKTIYKVRKPAA